MMLMVVEDEGTSRAFITSSAEYVGWKVSDYKTFSTAHKSLENNPARIDALVTDILLPDGHGVALAEYARRKRQDLPIVIVTAFNLEEDLPTKKRVEDLGARVLTKPVHRQVMNQELQAIFVRLTGRKP